MSASQARRADPPGPRYAYEAYEFVFAALAHAQRGAGQARRGPTARTRTSPARELLGGVRELAVHEFGLLARRCSATGACDGTDDFGEIVENLISVGLMSRTAEDERGQFHEAYDLAAITEGLRIEAPRGGGGAMTARRARTRLLLAVALFGSWIAYLGYLVASRPRTPDDAPLVLSRRLLASDADVIAFVQSPEQPIKIERVLWAGGGVALAAGQGVRVEHIDRAGRAAGRDAIDPPKDYTGPGRT